MVHGWYTDVSFFVLKMQTRRREPAGSCRNPASRYHPALAISAALGDQPIHTFLVAAIEAVRETVTAGHTDEPPSAIVAIITEMGWSP